ncbi:hypothetical protein Taro_048755 [Colocasia esculenta]|uniref:Transposase n=1 Tax=Colocasia esculenta TaxID=4460 RepID=A0A843X8Y0_COLES|nr:hypothetical protein [Colocasia esculenta]
MDEIMSSYNVRVVNGSCSERSSRDDSRLRRHRTLSVPLPPTSHSFPPPPTSQVLPPASTSQELPLPPTFQQIAPSSIPQGSSMASASSVAGPTAPSAPSWGRGTGRRGPTRGVTERRLPNGQQWNVSLIRGYGVGPTADIFTSRMGVVSKLYCKIWQKDFAKLPVATKELIFKDLQLTYQWERTDKTDREMLAHMSDMHRSWRSKQKKRHFNGKSLDDAIVSVPVGVDSSDWQTMCEMWINGDERRVVERNKQNRSTQSMTYRRGRTSHYQLMNDFETMTQLMAPSSDVDAESHTPATPKEAFISVMGKDRPGRVRCAGSGETLSTWHKSTGTSGNSERERIMQEQLKAQEEKLKAQAEEMSQMREKITRLENIATKVDEMSTLLSQIQASQKHTQHVPPVVQSESETDEEADDYSDHDDHVS